MSCGGKHLHIATLMQNIHGVWAHPLALILWCQLLKQFWRMDGWTWEKRCVLKKHTFWLGRAQTGRMLPNFGRIFPYFRAPSGRPSAKKGTFEVWRKKRPLHVCIVWANLPRTICHQNWAIHPNVRNWVLRATLMRAEMKEQSTAKNQSKEDRNDGIKHVNENQYFGNLRSCTFNQPKSKWHLQQWLASWQCGTFIWFRQFQLYLHEGTSLTCKKSII